MMAVRLECGRKEARGAFQLDAVGSHEPYEAKGDEQELRAGHRNRRERQSSGLARADRQNKQRAQRGGGEIELQQRQSCVPRGAGWNAIDARAGCNSRDT